MQSTTPDRAFDALEVAHLEHGLRLAGALLDRDASLRLAGHCLACRDRAHRTFALALDASWSIYHDAVTAHLPEPKKSDLQQAAKAFEANSTPRYWRSGEAA